MMTAGGLCEKSVSNTSYRFAAESEYDAMIKFADYADKCESPDVREAFLSIAREEAVHYARLKEKVDEFAASAG